LCHLENRGGHRGAPRGGSGRTLRFDGEFDFETSNAQFDKDQIEKELKEKLTLGIWPRNFSFCNLEALSYAVIKIVESVVVQSAMEDRVNVHSSSKPLLRV